MRTDLDSIRSAPLPDSFDQAAAWLRDAPPPRSRRAPARALVAAAILAAAAFWPVDTTVAAGSVIEVASADRIGAGHPALVALDRIVPDVHRRLVKVESVGEEGDGGTVLRYAVLGAAPETAEPWRDTVAALPGTRASRVLLLDVTRSRPFGVSAARRVLGGPPGPGLSDAELQVEVDRVAFASGPIRLRIRRAPDGAYPSPSPDRVTIRPRPAPTGSAHTGSAQAKSAPAGSAPARTVPAPARDRAGSHETGRDRARVRRLSGVPLDSLPPEVARALRDRLGTRFLPADSLQSPPRTRAARQFIWVGNDTLPLPAGTRVDTIDTLIRIYTLRDSL